MLGFVQNSGYVPQPGSKAPRLELRLRDTELLLVAASWSPGPRLNMPVGAGWGGMGEAEREGRSVFNFTEVS